MSTVIPDAKPSAAGGSLTTPITYLKGVGPRLAARLNKLGVETVQDLLFHLPARYQDRTQIVPIGALRPGDEVVVQGEVLHSEVQRGRRED